MYYQFTSLESYVQKLFGSISIEKPTHFYIEDTSKALDIDLNFWDKPSEAIILGSNKFIFIDNRVSRKEQRQKFAHELCHILMHCGQQYGMPELFREYQEWKAYNFTLHFCVPSFMLRKIDLPFSRIDAIYEIAKVFDVTIPFASERLHKYESQLIGARVQQNNNILYHY